MSSGRAMRPSQMSGDRTRILDFERRAHEIPGDFWERTKCAKLCHWVGTEGFDVQ